jgi:hypothetical protein
MVRFGVVLAFICALAGCARQEASAVATDAAPGAPAALANRNLAFEHSITLETDGERIVSLFDAARNACREAVADGCVMLASDVTRGEHSYARLRFRAQTAGIARLVAVLAAQGEVSSQSTTAEDLSGPLEDNARRLSMLTEYRSQLQSLRTRNSNDLETLMRLSRELAEVQAQIETLTGSQAQLTRRVETEILNVEITTRGARAFWKPASEAVESFAAHLSEALALVITVFAYLLPWALFALVAISIARAWRRRARRRAAV